jgi:hypothetical protein
MVKIHILYRGFSGEDREAEKILHEAGIIFSVILNNHRYKLPTFRSEEGVPPHEGLEKIQEWIKENP